MEQVITKPMLAGTLEDIGSLKYPILCTPKLDGIRCLKIGGKALSRNFKPIPNNYIRSQIEKINVDGLDGELIIPNCAFNKVSSAVMSEDGEPTFEYWVFDYVKGGIGRSYEKRMQDLFDVIYTLPKFIKGVHPNTINSLEELLEFERVCLEDGYEGVMIRSVDGPYKCGRSTNKEGYLLKMKRFLDSEAEIVGFEEKWHNTNEAKKDELGRTKRSQHQDNLVGAGMLGKFVVRDLKTGAEFSIGSGYTDELRKEVWKNPYSYVRKIVKYKYQPSGMKELPRFPVFLGFRDNRDMSE